MEKQNLTQQKHTFTNQKKYTTTQNLKKLKPGLVVLYNIWPRNGEGLFWFWHFINLSLTYLDTYPLTYSPGTHTGHSSQKYYINKRYGRTSGEQTRENWLRMMMFILELKQV